MNHTRILLAALLAALLSTACGHKNSFTIQGTLADGAGKTLYIEEISPTEVIFIDSVRLDSKGQFSYTYDMPYESIYTLHATPTDYIMFIPHAGEHIQVNGTYDRLSWTYTIQGSPQSVALWQLQTFTNETNQKVNDLVTTLENLDQQLAATAITQTQYDKEKAACDSIYLECYGVQQDYIRQMINDHNGSLVSLIAVHKPFNNQHPVIDPQFNTDYYEAVLEGLEAAMPDNPHTLYFHNEVARYQALYKEI